MTDAAWTPAVMTTAPPKECPTSGHSRLAVPAQELNAELNIEHAGGQVSRSAVVQFQRGDPLTGQLPPQAVIHATGGATQPAASAKHPQHRGVTVRTRVIAAANETLVGPQGHGGSAIGFGFLLDLGK